MDSAAAHAPAPVTRPLAVDLDGTLLRTDSLVEALLRLAAHAPLTLLRLLPVLFTAGRAAFKQRVARQAPLDPATLVYNDDVLALIASARAAGRKVHLVTASDAATAGAVARHLGLFDAVHASDGARNLKGAAKAAFLAAEFGAGAYEYAGDAAADLPVWRGAARAYVVAPAPGLLRAARDAAPDLVVLGARPRPVETLRRWARALRVHQWAKNVLVFLPVIAGHRFGQPTLIRAAAAFAAFSLCASSVYLLNDLLDLPHDRLHATKRRRPFAAGTLDIAQAPPVIALCLLGAFAIATALPPRFLLMLAVYYACTLSYSFALKRRALWDVMMLAGLYTLRVFVGAAATSIEISPWLLAFSLFLFFSLAVVKRQTELVLAVSAGAGGRLSGRGYGVDDLDLLRVMAASSGYMAVLVMALYVNSPDVRVLYRHPAALWVLCPALLFWISRVLLLAHRGDMHDDPVVFALRDRVSLAIGAACLAAFAAGAL